VKEEQGVSRAPFDTVREVGIEHPYEDGKVLEKLVDYLLRPV
jgi:hypothetical protein